MMPGGLAPEPDDRVEQILERELARVQSPEAADAVLDHVERLVSGETEESAGEQQARHDRAVDTTPTRAIDQAAAHGSPPERVASTLATTAAESVAPTPSAPSVLGGAQRALTPSGPDGGVRSRRGRALLRNAVLRRMGPLQRLDARLYLAINGAPHPSWLDRLGWATAIVFTGGWIWALGVLVARVAGVRRSGRALRVLLPALIGATWLVDYPIKALFRRRRPFIDIVRALVIGKKPGSWSFPSGHTASSFAGAWVLSRIWPARSGWFFGVAGLVGFSRIYVGAHYPGDVLSGALAGICLSALISRSLRRPR